MREKIARIIEPIAWEQYNHALRPYAEGRGSIGLENTWYALTYRRGCRTAEDVTKWFLETPYEANMPTYVMLARESLRKADQIIKELY